MSTSVLSKDSRANIGYDYEYLEMRGCGVGAGSRVHGVQVYCAGNSLSLASQV